VPPHHPPRSVLPLVAAGVAAALLALQLFIPPIVGLANNGDFERVMGYAGFQYPTNVRAENYFSWIVTKFVYGPPGWYRSGLRSSEILLAALARVVSEPFARGGLFDLRVLGAIHALLLVIGLGLLVSATRPLSLPVRLAGATLLVFFFTDVGYAAPLNSFYTQAASLAFLLLTLGIAARSITKAQRSTADAVLFFAFALLFVGSKPQEVVQAPLLAGFGVGLYGARGRRLLRQPAIVGAALLCLFALWYYRQTPPGISDVAKYHKIFMELLPGSPAPEQDLADLGLDPAWTTAVGKIAYKPDSPFHDDAFRGAFLERFHYRRLLAFYAAHPRRLAATLEDGGRQALTLRLPRLGNFEHKPGVAAGEKARAFSLWSSARALLPGNALMWLIPFFAANVVLAAATYRHASPRGKRAREGVLLLVAMATAAFLVCVLANAHGDLARHFYVFHALCDLTLAADLVWVTQALVSRRAS
jgi:hypothetical protein